MRISTLCFFVCAMLSQFQLNAQNPPLMVINGPTSVCTGECATYSVVLTGGGSPANAHVIWFLNNGVQYSSQGFSQEICFDTPGTYVINAIIETSDLTFPATLNVFVSDGAPVPELLYSDAPQCPDTDPADSLDCDRLCAQTTVTYTLSYPLLSPPYPGVFFLYADFSNVSDVQYVGDQVRVTWASPGIGELVAAYAFEGIGGTFPQCTSFFYLCAEVLAPPVAGFTTSPAASNDTIRICKGENLQFTNTTSNANTYLWDFGDFSTSTEVSPNHIYAQAGTFNVTMIAGSDCNCLDTAYAVVVVEDTSQPPITCDGAVCPGATVTYTTAEVCAAYDWNVSPNGAVIDGGGPADPYITITWNSGYVGEIELSVTNCVGAGPCLRPTRIEAPILSDDVQIEGPAKACRSNSVLYSVPAYDGADIVWSVSQYGTIVAGQGANEVSVNWADDTPFDETQWVAVQIDHCYLGCGGSDTLEVNVKPIFRVTGAVEACPGSSSNYTARSAINNDPVVSSWELQGAGGNIAWTSAAPVSTATVPWSVPQGQYLVVAFPDMPNEYCVDSAFVRVAVPDVTPPVDSIIGPTQICANQPYLYEVATAFPTNNFSWQVVNNGVPSTRAGRRISVTWASPNNNSLSVVQTSAQGCASTPVMLNIQQVQAPTISGDNDVCMESTAQYSAQVLPQLQYEWSISPSDAGTIISDPTAAQIEVLWHRAGPATVELDICNQTSTYNVNVLALPTPTIVHPGSLCDNVNAQVQTSVAFAGYIWRDQDGDVISNAATPSVGPGYYQVIVTDAFGCVGEETFQIDVLPAPSVRLSTPGVRCLNIEQPTLYTIGNQTTSSYEWYRDGMALGVNAASLLASIAGVYTVEVTDVNGCISASNVLEVFGDCGSGGAGGGLPGGGSACDPGIISPFDIIPGFACNDRSYQITSPQFIPGSAIWNFDDPESGPDNTSTLDNPSHLYTTAGFHEVIMFANYNEGGSVVSCGIFRVDTVALAADFIVYPACPGAAAQFNDRSTYLPFVSIASWQWDFGDPASGAANFSGLQNPTHVYNTPGTYNAVLTVTSSTGCQAVISKPVEVFSPPVISFTPPVENCEGTPLQFQANVPPDIASLNWDFGDPFSGDANTSTLASTYHAYESSFVYVVQLSAEDIQGCTAVVDQPVTVTANNLSGNISVAPASIFCEGDSVTLTAPAGGVSWSWSNGAVTSNLLAGSPGAYRVTVTNAQGCTYSPNPVNLQMIAAPYSDIRAYELDESGQQVAFYYDTLQVCYGEPVYLEAIGGGLGYSYQWSTGQSGQVAEFSEDRGNLLSEGQHDISLTVVNQINGCSAVVGPFVVNVNPNPVDLQISTQPTGLLCESTPITFSVDTPESGVNYFWSTGQTGPSIINTLAGNYYAVAVNSFGCQAQSNTVNVQKGPNVKQVPSGCHTRCLPDTICVPPILGAVSYQWYLNGNAIAAPEGTMLNLAPMQSGNYTLEVTDALGCQLTSADLNLDLFPGYGTISGSIYVDVNDNGIIDLSDTLFNGGGIFISDPALQVDTLLLADNGSYIWVNAPANDYTLVLDTLSLPSNYQPIYVQVDSTLSGCPGGIAVDWLLKLCPLISSNTVLSFCEGESVVYQGQTYAMDTTFSIQHQALSGCDSLENVAITMLPSQTMVVDLSACPGDQVTYEGISLAVGDQQDFIYTNQYGCDSIISVSVLALPTDASSLTLQTCPGTTIDYNGTALTVGDQIPFTFTNSLGCDSVVTVSVTALPTDATSLALQTCPGTTIDYNGTALGVGDQVAFTLANSLGCDSIVTVTVSALPTSTGSVSLQSCPGEPLVYNGITLNVGDQVDFTFANSVGCDSVVTVTVSALPTSTGIEQLEACTGTTVTYNGQTLLPGSQTSVTLTNSVGCDSIVTVTVVELFPDTSDLQLLTCPGETITYQGAILQAGDTAEFVLAGQGQAGCDSIVRVSVSALVVDTTQLAFQACEGASIDVNGITINAGETQTITLSDQQGCDSVIIVSVSALPAPDFSASSTASCPNSGTGAIRVANVNGNGPFEYSIDGNTFQQEADFSAVEAGDYLVVVRDANGCESENTVAVPTLESLRLSTEEFILPCNELQVEIGVNILSGLVGQISYLWDNGDTTATRIVTAAGVYNLQVSNDCEAVGQSVSVVPEVRGKLGIFYIPNAFSPNSDGINDLFQVFTGEGVQVEEFQLNVFDRWGNMLYSSDDYTAGWDGDYRGKAMNPGIYVWHLKAVVFRCGQLVSFEDKGDVGIVK